MEPIIKHFTDNDLYSFTVGYYVIMNYPQAQTEFEFFDRNGTVYLTGFDKLLREQVNYMKNVVITDEEVEFMLKKCYYLPKWYIDVFLRGFRFNPSNVHITMDAENHLHIKVIGDWFASLMWEMPLLSIISELMHTLRIEDGTESYNKDEEYQKSFDKGLAMLKAGLTFSEFGTRRRFSYKHHDNILHGLVNASKVATKEGYTGKFAGTSNVYFAMKYDLVPIGTMSHQIISFEENVASVFEANYSVMNKWANTYGGDLGVYLYDCFGDDVFFDNFSKKMALLFMGLRVDSGVNEHQLEKIISKYESLGIDARSKQVVFSNALNVDQAIALHNYVGGRMQDSYGIGTNLTCDVTGAKPMNIVIKLVRCRITPLRNWLDCVKLSCDKGKTLGNEAKCRYLINAIELAQVA